MNGGPVVSDTWSGIFQGPKDLERPKRLEPGGTARPTFLPREPQISSGGLLQ